MTVPMTTVPIVEVCPAIINGLRMSRADFIALALRRRLGTNTLPASNSCPIASIAGIMDSSMMSCGVLPLFSDSWTAVFAKGAIPLKMAWYRLSIL